MSTQEHVQKSPQTQNNVEIPEFAVQSKTITASPPTPPSGNLKTQLSRATRFGHNLTQMPALQAKAATGQPNLPIQRQAEEEPEQMKSDPTLQLAIQRQAAPAATSPSPSNAMAGMDAHSFYGMMNHQVESILPQLQAKMMQQPMSGEMAMQMKGPPPKGGAGGGKGGGIKGKMGNMKGKMGGMMGKMGGKGKGG
ncbi:MAG: hypothetical protein HC941_00315 [Microcoleus sp. SU_5_3]|nr:hypothetical protein [Microcoleus sp. SU_5_3]